MSIISTSTINVSQLICSFLCMAETRDFFFRIKQRPEMNSLKIYCIHVTDAECFPFTFFYYFVFKNYFGYSVCINTFFNLKEVPNDLYLPFYRKQKGLYLILVRAFLLILVSVPLLLNLICFKL